ncbi:MAG: 50S ribosomal protein L6 [Planctomycetes bacterium]|nr:50S ribosomal protein L6 [Planctomycetota bacterium]
MSRIGKKQIPIPAGVAVQVASGEVHVKGPKGEASFRHRPEVTVDVVGSVVVVGRRSEERQDRAYHGLTRALVANMVRGVHEGYQQALEIIGTGYNAKVQGAELTVQVGYCHPVVLPIPRGLAVECPNPTRIHVKGVDRQLVGQFAAEVRRVRPPEPYKGKGIRYDGEEVKRKAGKAFAGSE